MNCNTLHVKHSFCGCPCEEPEDIGTQWFTIISDTAEAPENARIGDIVLNGGDDAYTVGGVVLQIGDFAKIVSVDPFELDADLIGNIRGAEGLQGLQGPDGVKGLTGEDGTTPHIGANGNWFVGEVDTGVNATGPQGIQGDKGDKGDTGQTGANGTTYNWLTGSTDPSNSLGVVGDMYLNTSNCDVFKKTATTTWTLQCNIKGVSETNLNMELIFSGDANTVGSSYSVTKTIANFKALLIEADVDASADTYQSRQSSLIAVNSINIGKLREWQIYTSMTATVRVICRISFVGIDKFRIDILETAPISGITRIGITKIWGVY